MKRSQRETASGIGKARTVGLGLAFDCWRRGIVFQEQIIENLNTQTDHALECMLDLQMKNYKQKHNSYTPGVT